MLRVDQVVGARRADLAHLGRARRGRERDGLGAAVDLEHDAVGVGEQRAAERGERLRRGGRPRVASPSSATLRPPSPKRPSPAASIASRGARDELDRARGSSPRRVSPQVTSPCFSSSTARAAGLLLEQLGDAARHVEAGALVVEPDGLVAERLLGELAAASGDEVSAMIASGCVWSTCAAGTNACSSVSIDGRGWSGPSAQRSR